MQNRRRNRGSTLVEVLISFAILTTTGTLLVGFLYRNPMTNKAWIDDYGTELSKTALLTVHATNDTTLQHTDARGNTWETLIKVSTNENETCYSGTSVRFSVDTTRTLHYCTYGSSR